MRRTRFFLFILPGFLGLLSGPLQAQVAAPRLDTTSFKNPAVLPFLQSSQVGVRGLDIDWVNQVDTNSDGVVDTTRNGSAKGLFAQLLLVGGGFALAVGGGNLDIDQETEERETGVSNVSLALSFGDALGLGINRETSSTTEKHKTTGKTTESDATTDLGGVTLRLGEVVFLGGAAGKKRLESRTDLNLLDAPVAIEDESQVIRVGAGLYQRTGDSGYHVEVYREEIDQDELEIQGTVTGFPVTLKFKSDEETTGVVLEFLTGNFLFGVQSESKTSHATGELFVGATLVGSTDSSSEEDTNTVTLGYVPLEGGAIFFHYSKGETTQSDSPDLSESELMAVSLGLMF